MINKKNKFLYLVSSQKKLVRLITSFFKLKLKYNPRFDVGLIGEKDSGESFTWNQKSKGFDFYSA
mgnify:CR=1 FL=1